MVKQIVKIVICGVLALALTAALAGLLLVNAVGGRLELGDVTINLWQDDGDYTVGDGEINADGVKRIEVQWTAGSVTLRPYDGKTIRLTEPQGLAENERLRWRLDGGTLRIRTCRSRLFGLGKTTDKPLEILIPDALLGETGSAAKLESLSLETVSADIHVSLEGYALSSCKLLTVSGGIDASRYRIDTMNAESVSGSVRLSDCANETLTLETVSGEVSFGGAVAVRQRLSFESVSGTLSGALSAAPNQLNCDTTSGDITLAFPSSVGFAAELSSVSGDLRTENFTDVTQTGKNSVLVGSGEAKFRFDSVSGSVRLRGE